MSIGLSSGLYSGVSGLNANGAAMGVIGNNIANINTVGFKQGRTVFADLFSSFVDNSNQIGNGVKMQSIDNLFSQGSLQTTENSTDLAIQGDTFFVLHNANGQFFSRAGAFRFNDDQTLVNPDGLEVMAYGIIPNTNVNNGIMGPVTLTSFATCAPKMTSKISLLANLDASAQPPVKAWDPTNPVATSNFSSSMAVYDSQGNSHAATVYFVKNASNSWDWHAILPDATAGSPVDGTLTFNSSGSLTGQTPAANALNNITFANGSTVPQPITFDFGVGTTTQFASPSIVSSQEQDGASQGTLTKVTVDQKGYVNGVYNNGRQIPLFQLALAKFPSTAGLSKAGDSLFEETINSGTPQLMSAGSPGAGKIVSNSLEQSNVDMAAEFVKMITVQRGYSANSKTITTTDEMMQEVLNLKR